jgi:hypothetical protein
MLATGGGGGGGGHLKKSFPDIPKKFSGYTTFFPKYEKKFSDIPKNFQDIWYFPRKLKKFSGNIIDSSFQKCPLGKKCNLNDIFHARKGHFAPGKSALGKTWGAWPPATPGSYAPAYTHKIINYRRYVVLRSQNWQKVPQKWRREKG